MLPGLIKPVLSTQNTPIHIMVSISFSVCAIQNLVLLNSLGNSVYDEVCVKYHIGKKS